MFSILNMTVADRISQKMREHKLKAVDIAKATKASKGSVSQWINGISEPSGRYLLPLAKALHCEASWLLTGIEPEFTEYHAGETEQQTGYIVREPDLNAIYAEQLKKVPLISSVQAGSWAEVVSNHNPDDPDEWRVTAANVSKDAFALRVIGDSMVNPYGFPSIPEGAVVIVEPNKHAENGNIVVAMLEGSQEATIKRLVVDGPNTYLKALNPDYRPIKVNGECTIMGVVKKVELDL